MLEDIREKQKERLQKIRRRKRILRGVLLLVLLLGCLFIVYFSVQNNKNFEITEYNFDNQRIDESFSFVLLSDLHNREYGENNCKLVKAIQEYNPDFILMCGDMVLNSESNIETIIDLCNQLKNIADIYYIYGNHEGDLQYNPNGFQIPLDNYLIEAGVTVCYYGDYEIRIGRQIIDLFSISIEAEEYKNNTEIQESFKKFVQKDTYKIVASHYPQVIYDALYKESFDLGVAGHFHGGQVIIPGIGGLYHKDTGMFPQYYGGLYKLDKGNLIVSRGLGNSGWVPRINNKPELVVIRVNSRKGE